MNPRGWGEKGHVVGQVSILHPQEPAGFDEDVLKGLWQDVGPAVAENIFCRALEDLAIRLTQIRNDYASGDNLRLRRSVRRLGPVADQIGLGALSLSASAVVACIDREDPVATAATLCRLLRGGEAALSSAFVSQDLTV